MRRRIRVPALFFETSPPRPPFDHPVRHRLLPERTAIVDPILVESARPGGNTERPLPRRVLRHR